MPPEDFTPIKIHVRSGSRSKQIQSDLEKDLLPYLDRQKEAVRRTAFLLKLSREVSSREIGEPSQAEDLLRAAVVLTHAYLEDFLRTMAASLLPEGGESSLDGIPLAGFPRGQKTTFSLGQLAKHRNKRVDQVLYESVLEYLTNQTYSNIGEIEGLLRRLGFDVSKLKQEFPMVAAMIQRRHDIVHRADRVRLPDSDTHTLQPIQAPDVENWLLATFNLMTRLMNARLPKSLLRLLAPENHP